MLENPFPANIKPQQSLSINIFICEQTKSDLQIEFEWDDDYRKANKDSQWIQL